MKLILVLHLPAASPLIQSLWVVNKEDSFTIGKELLMLPVAEAVINTSIVTELVNLVKSVMGLFSEFPLNVLLIASLCFVAFGLFSRAKSAAM